MLRRLLHQTKTPLLITGLCLLSPTVWAVNWQSSALEGVDANSDGIRDDVATFINSRFDDAATQFWAREAARAGQAYLMSNGNAFALHRAHAFMERARRCLTKAKAPETANTVINQVLGKQLDSYKRQQAYKEAVNNWMYKVSHEGLPSQPDADWSPSCEGLPGAPIRVFTEVPTSAQTPIPESQSEETIPPPNFFITRAMPREDEDSATNEITAEAPSASVVVQALPVTKLQARDPALPTVPLPTAAEENSTPTTGSWQTYRPRPADKSVLSTNNTTKASHLPVQKLRPGQSAAIAPRIAKQQPKTVHRLSPQPVEARRTAAAVVQPTIKPAAQETDPLGDLPPALRELAPFIQSIERR